MKILQIVDVDYWAIGKLSKSIVKYNPHFDWRVLYVHPKHVEEHLDEVREWIDWADIIDYQYWNTAKQLRALIPELKKKKSTLTHHNEKDLLGDDWSDIHTIVAETKKSKQVLDEHYQNVKLIPLATDLEFFKYKEKINPESRIVGYCGRIVPWKGLKEIAAACYELGYGLAIMGKFDKPSYWNEIPPEHIANMDLSFMDCDDDERADYYNSIDIYVGNSGPDRETGTLPLMEAMASGVPVVTTPSGIAADILEDQENAIVVPFGEYEPLKASLKMLMENNELKEKIRRNAWNTIKNFTEEQRAWEYQKVYYKVNDDTHPLVSVIIPTTTDRYDKVTQIITALENQTYKNIEAVVVVDQVEFADIEPPAYKNKIPIKMLSTKQSRVYGLAVARNIGAIEAAGDYLVFCDSRMCPEPDAIEKFMMRLMEADAQKKKLWVYGNKGTGKKTFVENFSGIKRESFIKAGMMNERMDTYGGLSQELRERFTSQEFAFDYIDDAKATQLSSSHLNPKRRADIVYSKLKLWKMGL